MRQHELLSRGRRISARGARAVTGLLSTLETAIHIRTRNPSHGGTEKNVHRSQEARRR